MRLVQQSLQWRGTYRRTGFTFLLSDTLLKDIKAECEASDLDFSTFMRTAAVAMMKRHGARAQSKDLAKTR
jgi:hypothetical protein